MRKKKVLIFVCALFLAIPSIVFATAGTQITATLAPYISIVINGKNIDTFENPAIVYNDSTYVPLRVVSEAFGYDVKWNQDAQRVDLREPEEKAFPLEGNGIRIIDYNAMPDSMTTFSSVSGRYQGEIIYEITEPLSTKASATFYVFNEDNNLMNFESIVFSRTEPGTYTTTFYTPYFNLPYSENESNYEDLMAKDYSYRLKVH